MSRCWARRGGLATVLGAWLALAGRTAAAEDSASQLDLVYQAPVECPSRAELEEQLRARVPARWLSRPDPRRFEVTIVREHDGGYTGRLDVRGASREPDVREIQAPTCQAVSTSLAVFLALALDPGSGDEPSAPSSNVELEEGHSQEHGTGRAPPLPSPRSSHASSPVWTWSSGLQARHLRAPAPGWGGRVFAELARRTSVSGAVTPAVRLSWGWTSFSTAAPDAGEASFRLRTARVEGCARFTIARQAFSLAPCAGLDIGWISGAAPELRDARHDTTGWSAGAAVLRGGWSVTDWVTLEMDATLLVPFERTSFVLLDPLRTVYQAPHVLFEAGAGACVSVRFR